MRHTIALFTIGTVILFCAKTCLGEDVADNKQKTFATPNEAFKALISGLEKNSDDELLDVLGHANKDLVVQSDKEATSQARERLSKLARESLRVELNGDKAVACFGYKCWPYPIPLAKKGDSWFFDTAAGKEEILNRRIGRNELKAIHFMEMCDDAQRVYASSDKNLRYAQKLISTKDKKDGLYWAPDSGKNAQVSPLAFLDVDGKEFVEGNGMDVPYHGYYYKMLTKQGSSAPNGKYDYVINGNMIGGFALIAWPADYGSSGIMTFMISHHGITFEKDLGTDTAKLAAAIDEYNPDATWKAVKAEEK